MLSYNKYLFIKYNYLNIMKKSKTFLSYAKIFLFLSVMPVYAQNNSKIQQTNLNEGTWEQVAPGLQRQWVTGNDSTYAYWKMDKGARVAKHHHANEQITYIAKGSVKVSAEGKELIVKEGDVLIIPPNVTHEFVCLEDGTVDIDFFTPARKDWIEGTSSYLGNEKSSLEEAAKSTERLGGVAVSADGRVFAATQPLGQPKTQLVEIKGNSTVPFPSEALQKNGRKASDETMDSPLGIFMDKKNRLWVIDAGLELGKTRLWCFDINDGKVLKKMDLPESVAPKGSFIQDLVVDEDNGWVYMADMNAPALIALDVNTGKTVKFADDDRLKSENKNMIIDGRLVYFNGQPARLGLNPITISADRETIFFGPMNGTSWYKVPAKLFRNHESNDAIAKGIEKVGPKPISDGAATDADGNHYFTNLQEHAVTKLDKDGKLTTIAKDHQLLWPESIALAGDGWIYVTASQLNATKAFTGGADGGKPPYFIYRLKK